MDGASEQLEELMKLITRFELAACTKQELHALYRKTFNSLAKSNAGTIEQANALGSLENISREISCRL